MDLRKKVLLTAMTICIAQSLQAQQYFNAWFRGTLKVAAGERTDMDAVFLHRRQSGSERNSMMDKNLMYAFIIWVHYKHNENIKFSVSPFSVFSHYKVILKQSDENAHPVSEFRFSAATELNYELWQQLYLVNRLAAEYRLFPGNEPDIIRVRNRIGINFDLNQRLRLLLNDEILLNVTGTSVLHFFDQNRIGLNLEYKLLPNLKLDAGFIYISRLPSKSDVKVYDNNITIGITYQLRA